jgi:hypothetical protein
MSQNSLDEWQLNLVNKVLTLGFILFYDTFGTVVFHNSTAFRSPAAVSRPFRQRLPGARSAARDLSRFQHERIFIPPTAGFHVAALFRTGLGNLYGAT